MRTYTSAEGFTVIEDDNEVIARVGGMDVNAPSWTYTNRSGETVTVDVRGCRPNLDSLSKLYDNACASKRPEDAAAYVQHKNRVLALFEKRDVDGHRYE